MTQVLESQKINRINLNRVAPEFFEAMMTIFAAAEKLSHELEAAGLDVIYDDRPKVSPGVKFGDAELVGVPTILAVGRGLVDGVVEIKDRRSGNAENVAVEKAVAYVVNAIRNS